jgi:hypothetical protein
MNSLAGPRPALCGNRAIDVRLGLAELAWSSGLADALQHIDRVWRFAVVWATVSGSTVVARSISCLAYRGRAPAWAAYSAGGESSERREGRFRR